MTDTDNNANTVHKETAEEEAKRLGVSVRTIYRRRAREKEKSGEASGSKPQAKTQSTSKQASKSSTVSNSASADRAAEAAETLPLTGGGSEKMLATMVEAWTKMLDIQREQIQRMDKAIELLAAAVNSLSAKDSKKSKKEK